MKVGQIIQGVLLPLNCKPKLQFHLIH